MLELAIQTGGLVAVSMISNGCLVEPTRKLEIKFRERRGISSTPKDLSGTLPILKRTDFDIHFYLDWLASERLSSQLFIFVSIAALHSNKNASVLDMN